MFMPGTNNKNIKKKRGDATEKAAQQARSFEVSVADMAKKSERRAWIVAFSATTMAVLLAAGYIFIMPLKEQVPYLVLADPYRGTSSDRDRKSVV